MVHRALLMAVIFGLSGCGGGSSPSAPTPSPTPVATTVSVSINPSTDLLKIQGTETFTVTATMSDGSSKAVSGAWATDAATVATVDSAGKVTGVGPGQAAITVTYDGAKATRTVRVVPDYQGNWTGDYKVLSCQDSGDFSREEWCHTALEDGVIRVSMMLTQARDTVTGPWTHGSMAGTAQGTIETDGTLALSGTGNLDSIPMTITGWRSRSADNKSQTGTFTLTFTSSVWSGSSQASVEIRTCAKGS
jgi:hypothetical protein